MEFNDNKPIYRQIVDYAYNQIIERKWEPGERVPSVRELSAELGVNSRTVLKAMEDLQNAEIIYSKRGMGFHLNEDATEKVIADRRREFFRTTLPTIAAEMHLLGISPSELLEKLDNTGDSDN